MRNRFFLFSLLLLLVASGCIKEPDEIVGCSDPESLTYNPNATLEDNSLCFYWADSYAGDYFAVETVTETDLLSSDSTVSLNSYNFRIAVDRQPDDIFLINFIECSDTLMGGASAEVITVADGSACDFAGCTITNTAGELSYDFSYTVGTIQYRHAGNAVRN